MTNRICTRCRLVSVLIYCSSFCLFTAELRKLAARAYFVIHVGRRAAFQAAVLIHLLLMGFHLSPNELLLQ